MENDNNQDICREVFSDSLLIFLFFLVFSGLYGQSRSTQVIRLGQEFELKIDQDARIEGEDLAIVFDSVLEDSRCPVGVDCVWSGNAKIRFKLSDLNQTSEKLDLNTDHGPKSSSYRNYEVRLVELKPARKSDQPLRPEDYQALLVISKK